MITGMDATSVPKVILEIKDDGPGIEAIIMAQIFEGQVTTKTVDQGTGLGFTIVKRLIQGAGAALHLHTEIGIGTICTIYLR